MRDEWSKRDERAHVSARAESKRDSSRRALDRVQRSQLTARTVSSSPYFGRKRSTSRARASSTMQT